MIKNSLLHDKEGVSLLTCLSSSSFSESSIMLIGFRLGQFCFDALVIRCHRKGEIWLNTRYELISDPDEEDLQSKDCVFLPATQRNSNFWKFYPQQATWIILGGSQWILFYLRILFGQDIILFLTDESQKIYDLYHKVIHLLNRDARCYRRIVIDDIPKTRNGVSKSEEAFHELFLLSKTYLVFIHLNHFSVNNMEITILIKTTIAFAKEWNLEVGI